MEDDQNRILEELAALRADTLAIALRDLSAEVRASQTAVAAQHAENALVMQEIRLTVAEIRTTSTAALAGSLQGKLADAFISSDWKGRAAFLALPALCLILTAAWLSGERLTDILQSGASLVHGQSPAIQQETHHAAP